MCGHCHHSIPYAMHYGYCSNTGTFTCMGTAIALYCMLCMGTATCVGAAIALYCMLCTTGTVTCVGAAIVLYCGLCTTGIATCVGIVIAYTILLYVWVLPSLHAVCYALRVLPSLYTVSYMCMCWYCQCFITYAAALYCMLLMYVIICCVLSATRSPSSPEDEGACNAVNG